MQQRKGPLASSSGPRLKIAYPEKSTVRPVIAVRIEHPFLIRFGIRMMPIQWGPRAE
jgi:hypothetical protein